MAASLTGPVILCLLVFIGADVPNRPKFPASVWLPTPWRGPPRSYALILSATMVAAACSWWPRFSRIYIQFREVQGFIAVIARSPVSWRPRSPSPRWIEEGPGLSTVSSWATWS